MKKYFSKFLKRIAAACIGAAVLLSTKARAEELTLNQLVPVIMPPGAEYVVIDVLDGVEARYRTMSYYDVYGTYSCAGYPKAYYQALYAITVQNLMDTGPPHPADLFVRVDKPQKGDLIFYPSPPNKNNHSAIVKAFDGERIILIEQDYKWAQGNETYTYINRTIPYPPDDKNVYEIWRLSFVPEVAEKTEPPIPEPEYTEPVPPEPEYAEPVPPEPEYTPDGTGEPSEPTQGHRREAVVTIGRDAITVDGVDIPIDAPALIENNRTMVPVRWVMLALGIEDLLWDGETRQVTIQEGDTTVLFTIDSYLLLVNDAPVLMDCPAKLYGDRAYLPIRFLAEALSIDFTWDGLTASATFYRYI